MAEFSKHNASAYPDSLYAEVDGLERLRSTLHASGNTGMCIPQVYSVDEQTLNLQAIRSQTATAEQLAILGHGLAELHRMEQPYYGLDRDNYIGLSVQKNGRYDNWGEFFVEQRLAFQVSLIKSASLQQSFQSLLQQHKQKVISFLNQHCSQPSLVHGDLWSGNVLFDAQADSNGEGRVWLIDPAVHFGDREVDIAMTELFGGFAHAFYHRYDQCFPLSAAYPQKKVIYNLYHQLNHYNLFGQAYLSGCEQGFRMIAQL